HMNIVYGEVHGTGLIMDVFTPKSTDAALPGHGLAIIDVVSGSFFSDRGKLEDPKEARMYDIYCGSGYTVFAVRPGSITKYTGREMNRHVKQGIRWVKAHAKEYGIDPDRLGITGASAGGYLATYAAVTGGAAPGKGDNGAYDTKVAAAAVFFPPTDFTLADWTQGPLKRFGPFFFRNGFDGRSSEQIATRTRDLSPRYQIGADTPPFLFIHGDADPLVDLEQSEVMVQALKDAGHEATLIVKAGGAHPWPTIYEEVAVMCDWFSEHLKKD
ncbi:MAG: alpha/beta hydrolase, partial [Candidatus Hydrogenedentes bacterium]|nr:alpha/beta hydrolase [Candidatus Hydrogenedentota bacterium]